MTTDTTAPTLVSPAAGPAPESRFATVDGVTYHYHDIGAGPDTIFLHGGGPGCTAWSDFGPVAPHFAEDRHCVLVDILQYGQSEKCLITGPDVGLPRGQDRRAHGRARHREGRFHLQLLGRHDRAQPGGANTPSGCGRSS